MAQNIALLIHSQKSKKGSTSSSSSSTSSPSMRFACHHTSHLLLWEENSYKELLNMDAVEISTREDVNENGIHIPPLRYEDVSNCFLKQKEYYDSNVKSKKLAENGLSTLIIELPHRELGGKLTPWKDVLDMGELCKKEDVKFHCDGARIFEASAGYG